MTRSVEDEEPSQTDALERRRMQNRQAQRKFRMRKNQLRQYQVTAQAVLDLSSNELNPVAQPLRYNSWDNVEKLPYIDSALPHDLAIEAGQIQNSAQGVFSFNELAVNGADMFEHSYGLPDPDVNQPYFTTLPTMTPGEASNVMNIELLHVAPLEVSSAPSSASFPAGGRSGIHLSKSHQTHIEGVPHAGFDYSASPRQNTDQYGDNDRSVITSTNQSSSAKSQHPHVHSSSTSSSSDSRGSESHHNIDSEQTESVSMRDINANDWVLSLHIASYRGHATIVQVLLERDVDINERDGEGRTALHQAAMKCHVSVVKMLLQHGADVNAVDNRGLAALHWAALEKNEELLRLLIDAGAELNLVDCNGWTALHVAVERGFEPGLRLLLRHGADLSIRARKCETWKRSERDLDPDACNN